MHTPGFRWLTSTLLLSLLVACSSGAAPVSPTAAPAEPAASTSAPAPAAAKPTQAATSAPAPVQPTQAPTSAPAAPKAADISGLVAAAKAEGTVKYFTTTSDPKLQEVFKAFTDQYGVSVEMLQLTNAPLVERFYADVQRGDPPDVISLSDFGTLQTLIGEKHLASYESVAVRNDYPANLKTTLPYYVPTNITFNTPAYNSKFVSPDDAKKLTSWFTIFDPKWTERLGMQDPNHVGGMVNTLWAAKGHFSAEQWTNLLKQLAQLKPKLYNGSGPAGSALASGEIWVAWVADFVMNPLIAQDAPIAYTFLDPAPVSATTVALVTTAKRPNAGKLLIEWITGAEAQTRLAAQIGQAPANPKATDRRPVTVQKWFAPPKNVIPFVKPPTDAERTALISEFNRIVLGK